MKIFEIVLGILSLIGLTMLSMHLDGSAVLTAVGMLPLALLYLLFSFALLNGVKLRDAFRRSAFKNISTARLMGSIAYGCTLTISIIAIFFKVNQFPGANLMLRIALSSLFIGISVSSIRYLRKKDLNAYYPLLIRAAAFGIPVFWLILR